MPISVVVPAHDEEAVVGRCLDALAPFDEDEGLEVVVVCNGCTDQTARVAAAHGRGVRVAEIEEASKTAALNRGDEIARGYPRFYVDADMTLPAAALRELAATMQTRGALLCAPGLSYDVSESSAAVRAYYRIWTRLPSVRHEPVGRGVYGMSREGRARFDAFPDVVADDHYVRDLFRADERYVAEQPVSVVRAPATLRDLLRRKMRVFSSNADLDRRTEAGTRRGAHRRRQWLGVVREEPRLLASLPVYLFVSVQPRLAVRWRRLRGRGIEWGRDESGRAQRATEAEGRART